MTQYPIRVTSINLISFGAAHLFLIFNVQKQQLSGVFRKRLLQHFLWVVKIFVALWNHLYPKRVTHIANYSLTVLQ